MMKSLVRLWSCHSKRAGPGLIHDMTSGLTDIVTSFQSRVLERGYDGGSLRSGLRSGLFRSFMENRRGATERRREDLGRRQSSQSSLHGEGPSLFL